MSDDASPGDGLDLDSVPDSSRVGVLRPPGVRLDDLERDLAASKRDRRGLHREIDSAKSRVAWAIVTGALGMMATIVGAAWHLSGRLTSQEEAIRSVGDRVERVESRIDRIEERQWSGSRPSGGEP